MTSFFVLAFGLTWLCWLPAAFSAAGADSTTGALLVDAGRIGPLIATLIALAPRSRSDERARWLWRLTNIDSLIAPSGLLCLLAPILIAQWALGTYAITGGIRLPAPGVAEALSILVPTLVFGALPEELAWRGYALPSMLRGREPLAPTLWLAAAWGLWQLPLFFIKGTFEASIEITSAAGFLYFAGLAGQSVLMTAFYLATRCTWAAVLFHWLTGFMGEFWQMPAGAEVHRSLWTLLLAGIALLLRPPFGIRGPESPPSDSTGPAPRL